jgi:hypothetical protein
VPVKRAVAATVLLGWLVSQILAQEYTFTTVAGRPQNAPVDGIGRTAGFDSPNGLAIDKQGNLYVTDIFQLAVRKITPEGVVSTVAGGQYGFIDGSGFTAHFRYPYGLTVSPAGDLYVVDMFNSAIRRAAVVANEFGSNWVVTTVAGGSGVDPMTGWPAIGSQDGPGRVALFARPQGVATDTNGNVYVADSGNSTIRLITPAGFVTTIAGLAGTCSTIDGTNNAARFCSPTGVATDSTGNLYVVDYGTIRKMVSFGANWVVTTLAGQAGTIGSADGTNSSAQFSAGGSLAVDQAGNIYVMDAGNFTIRKVTPGGVVTTLAGQAGMSGATDGVGNAARFGNCYGVAVDSVGNVYVADRDAQTIRKVTPDGLVTTVAGEPNDPTLSADGTGRAARFNSPYAIAVDNTGNAYIADTENHTIRKMTTNAVVTTLAGLAGASGTNDGFGSDARFNEPYGLAVDNIGNVFVADTSNNTIRQLTPDGNVTTLAGDSLPSLPPYLDGLGARAHFHWPRGMAVDNAGHIYVADYANDAIREITFVQANWLVTSVAGEPYQWGWSNGSNALAQFHWPSGVAVDNTGHVYVADPMNNEIRKVSPIGTNWVVTTLAGKIVVDYLISEFPVGGYADGTGSAAQFNFPYGIAIDNEGSLYVADQGNKMIRKVTQDGVVTTVGGGGFANYYNFDGTGTNAGFRGPSGIAVDGAGNIYIADAGTSTIRLGTTNTCPDKPTIDRALAPVGEQRQLDTDPQTAVTWQWSWIRHPAASTAELSATNIRNPTFTPDVPDLYVFRFQATNASGAFCIRTLSVTATTPPRLLGPSWTGASTRFYFTVQSQPKSVVEIQESSDLRIWINAVRLTNYTGRLSVTSTLLNNMFYRAVQIP